LKNLSDGLEKLAFLSDMEGVISYGAGFAGSHVIDLVFSELGEKANEILETDYTFFCKWISEADATLRDYMEKNFEIPLMTEFTRELAATMAKDSRSKEMTFMEAVTMFFFGFTCGSRAGPNSKAHENLGRVQDNKEKTGEAYHESLAVIEFHRPERLYGENVRHLESHTPDHEFSSDSEYIKDQLKGKGYWVNTFIVRAQSFGSWTLRTRWLLFGMRSDIK